MKHVCSVCGWEYDEKIGYPDGGIADINTEAAEENTKGINGNIDI